MKVYFYIVGIGFALLLVRCDPLAGNEKFIKECAKEIGISKELYLLRLLNLDEPKIKCFSACLMKKYGFLVDGQTVVEKIVAVVAKFPEGVTDKIKADVTRCAGKANKKKGDCNVAGTFDKCFIAKHPQPKE